MNGSEAKRIINAVIMEIGKPSDRMLICGAAFPIMPTVRDVRNKVPIIGRDIIIASKNRRERPPTIIITTGSLPSIREMMFIVCTDRQKPPRKRW